MLDWKGQITVTVSKRLPRTQSPLHFVGDWERGTWWLGRETRPIFRV